MDPIKARQIIVKCINEFYEKYPEARKKFPLDTDMVLNEMAMSIKDYERLITSHVADLYNTACNICCLEQISTAVSHWRGELIKWFSMLLNPTIKNGIDKRSRLMKELIEPCLDPDTFEVDEVELFARAMRAEIKKAHRTSNNPKDAKRYQIESKYIEECILPNIDAYYEANKRRVGKLFEDAVDAICDADTEGLIEAIDNFIANKQ